MGKNSTIEWTHHTFNPWWGCQRVSKGCQHCYAETLAVKRRGLPIWGPPKTTQRHTKPHDSPYWREPLKWNTAAQLAGERHRVFCASMADVFESHPQLPPERAKLFCLIEETPHLDWLLLTKRPENVMLYAPISWLNGFPPNVWIGTSVEDQETADERIPILLQIPASIRFLSCEPLLGPIDLRRWLTLTRPDLVLNIEHACETRAFAHRDAWALHWVIAGGESGDGHRIMDLAWARSLRDQCLAAAVPFFFKQVGGRTPKAGGKELDGREWTAYPAPSIDHSMHTVP